MKTKIAFLGNLRIKTKIFISSAVIILLFIGALGLFLVPKMRTCIIDQKKQKLKEVTEVGISILQNCYMKSKNGTITEEEAQAQAIDLINALRYGPEGKDYLWINDFHPTMIMHPFNTALNGTDLSDYKDPNGKAIFLEFVKTCKEKGKGYVDYMWQWKDQKDKIVPKISYVQSFNQWGWIIGTGVYINDVNDEIWSILFVIIGVFAGVIAIMFGIFYGISRMITMPINGITEMMKDIAERNGDLTQRIEITTKDEIGDLAIWINRFINDIHDIVAQVSINATHVAQTIEQISSGNQNLSQRTSEQASALEEIATIIEEAVATIKQNSENSEEANKKAEEAARVVQEAKDQSIKSIQLAENGGTIVTRAVESINEVNKSSKKIADILKVINDIAFQTNLLALNAAVEAARAGDQGRGFAVVAGEVRNLAQRSAGAANEISDMITDSINKVELGTELVAKSGESLASIIESAKLNGEALERVIAAVGMVGQLISEIAAAGVEQRQGIEQINTAITEIDTTTQKNASLVEETASASEMLVNQASDLMKLVQKFKINEEQIMDVAAERQYAMNMEHLKKMDSERSIHGGGNGNGRKHGTVNHAAIMGAEKKPIREIMKNDGFSEF
ncbi:MAG TPA: methyl-accepting chemotaxis protein [Spirochaetota bacterium]|nr:methyl-accepting chemotaxis protein [Spirochaetota bacterium]HPV43497.1 methyl-accepting chemotaxis protein [Spirochaetota bacterium]